MLQDTANQRSDKHAWFKASAAV